MARELLSLEEMKSLTRLFRDVFAYTESIKAQSGIAVHIQRPKVPTILTESLVVHLMKEEDLIPEMKGFNLERGGETQSDICATGGKSVKAIEVKGTTADFIALGRKDLAADYLIWLQYLSFFSKPYDPFVDLCIVEKPGRYFDESDAKMNLGEFKKRARGLIEKKIRLDWT